MFADSSIFPTAETVTDRSWLNVVNGALKLRFFPCKTA
jgi:hypothetical protein